jgi:hypothetical protein
MNKKSVGIIYPDALFILRSEKCKANVLLNNLPRFYGRLEPVEPVFVVEPVFEVEFLLLLVPLFELLLIEPFDIEPFDIEPLLIDPFDIEPFDIEPLLIDPPLLIEPFVIELPLPVVPFAVEPLLIEPPLPFMFIVAFEFVRLVLVLESVVHAPPIAAVAKTAESKIFFILNTPVFS